MVLPIPIHQELEMAASVAICTFCDKEINVGKVVAGRHSNWYYIFMHTSCGYTTTIAGGHHWYPARQGPSELHTDNIKLVFRGTKILECAVNGGNSLWEHTAPTPGQASS